MPKFNLKDLKKLLEESTEETGKILKELSSEISEVIERYQLKNPNKEKIKEAAEEIKRKLGIFAMTRSAEITDLIERKIEEFKLVGKRGVRCYEVLATPGEIYEVNPETRMLRLVVTEKATPGKFYAVINHNEEGILDLLRKYKIKLGSEVSLEDFQSKLRKH